MEWGGLFADEGPADDHFFDFLGPFVNFKNLGGPVEALDIVIVKIAVAAVELKGFIHDFDGDAGGVELGHGGDMGVGRAVVQKPGRLVHDVSGQFHFDGHVCDFKLDSLEAADGFAELLPVPDMLDGHVEGSLGQAHAVGRDIGPAPVEKAMSW